jgi:5-methylcytosine-specific restriction endonuclease McrA
MKIDKADEYFSKYVRLKQGKCQRCGSLVKFNGRGDPISHQLSHFQGRRKEATRFDLDNADTLCGACHLYFTANPYEHVQWQVRVKGQKLVDEVVFRSNQYVKKDRKMAEMVWKKAYNGLLKEKK